MSRFLFLPLFFALTLFSCKNNKEVSANSDIEKTPKDIAKESDVLPEDSKLNHFLKVTTSPCFGQCPVYELTISENGGVHFNGKRFTQVEGTHTSTLNPSQLSELKKNVAALNVDTLSSTYDNPDVTDLPSTNYVFMTSTGEYKSVMARYDVPESLKSFQKYIDKLINTMKWDETELH